MPRNQRHTLPPDAADHEPRAEDEDREHPEYQLPGNDEDSGSPILRPPRNDPRHTDQSIPPGQDDVPAGSTRPARSGEV